ncbi:MAG: PHP domain-containing protein, partial [Acidobacteria bacterium]|nr:PHP domain-containing protein [Acidobacteriota bacterium]
MYAPLWCKSNFSFLEGASDPAELIEQAGHLGLRSIAVTDRDGLYGVVQAHTAAREKGLHLIVGAEMTVADPGVVLSGQIRAGSQPAGSDQEFFEIWEPGAMLETNHIPAGFETEDARHRPAANLRRGSAVANRFQSRLHEHAVDDQVGRALALLLILEVDLVVAGPGELDVVLGEVRSLGLLVIVAGGDILLASL